VSARSCTWAGALGPTKAESPAHVTTSDQVYLRPCFLTNLSCRLVLMPAGVQVWVD
jgi:hypothetical protein